MLLWTAYLTSKRSNRPDGEPRLRSRLVVEYLPLVDYLLRRHYRRHMWRWDDLHQEGAIGLMRAVERFDPAGGTSFWATYAPRWVRAYIGCAIRRELSPAHVPNNVTLPPEAIGNAGELEGKIALETLSEDQSDVKDRAEVWHLRRALDRVAEEVLDGRERTVLDAFYQGVPSAEVGRRLGVTRSRAKRLLQEICVKARARLAEHGVLELPDP